MVSKATARFLLPTGPLSALRLVEASVALWRASLRQTAAPALLCGIAALLPGIGLGDLPMKLAQQWLVTLTRSSSPLLDLLPVADLDQALPAVIAWLTQPATIALFVAALLLALLGAARIVQCQQRVAADPLRSAASPGGLVSCFGAWLVYTFAVLLAALPLLALWVALYMAAQGAGLSLLALLLLAFVIGSLLLSAPLVWASVALGLAPYCSVADRLGPLRAQRRSLALVRGHWTHAAIVISVPMFFYLGASSVISSSIMGIAAFIMVVRGGWVALFDLDWLIWSQLVALLPTALVTPLAFAGGVLCRNDLILRETREPDSQS